MKREEYKTLSRFARDNGHRYAVTHTDTESREILQRLHDIGEALDYLLERQRWANNPDTTAANIIRLTTPTH